MGKRTRTILRRYSMMFSCTLKNCFEKTMIITKPQLIAQSVRKVQQKTQQKKKLVLKDELLIKASSPLT